MDLKLYLYLTHFKISVFFLNKGHAHCRIIIDNDLCVHLSDYFIHIIFTAVSESFWSFNVTLHIVLCETSCVLILRTRLV